MPTYEVDFGGKTYEVDAPDPKTAWSYASYSASQAKPAGLESIATKRPPEVPAAADTSMFSGVGNTLADLTKMITGSLVGGTLSVPSGVEQGLKGVARQSMEGEPEMVMPASVYQPGLDTEETLFGKETEQQRAQRKLGAQRAVAALPEIPLAKTLSNIGRQTQRQIESTVSPETKKALEESQVTGNIFKGEIDFGTNPSVRGYAMQAASVLGSIAPVVVTAIATKSPVAGGAVGGGMAADEAGQNAAEFIGKMSDEELAKTSPFYAQMIAGGAKPEEARALTVRKAAETGAALQGMVATLGDTFTGKLVTGAFDDILMKAAGKSVIGKGVAGTALSSLEQGIGETAEGVASDIGIKTVAPTKEIGQDSAQNLIMGLLGGAGPGAVSAFAKQATPEEQQRAKYERPAPDQGIEELARAKGFLTPQAQGQAAPPPPPAAPRAPESESQDLEAMLREALGEEPSKVEAATQIVQAATEAAPIAPAKAPEVEQVPPEVAAETLPPTEVKKAEPAQSEELRAASESLSKANTGMSAARQMLRNGQITQENFDALKSQFDERQKRFDDLMEKEVGSKSPFYQEAMDIAKKMTATKDAAAAGFAKGIAGAARAGQLDEERMKFYRERLGDFEQRAPEARGKSTIKETRGLSDFVSSGNKGELARFEYLKNHPAHKDILNKASGAIQSVVDEANRLGFKILEIGPSSPRNLKEIRKQYSVLTGAVTRYMLEAERVAKKQKTANQEKLDNAAAGLEKDIQDAVTKIEHEKITTEAYEKVSKAVNEYNKIYANYQKNKTDENLRKLYEASNKLNELNISYDEVSLNEAQYQHSIGYLDDSQFETFTENNKNSTNSYKKNIAVTNKELEELAKKPSVEKAKPKTALEKASPLRIAAYKKNPFRTFLAEKGLYHEKGKPGSQMNEFNAGQQILVSGYGPIFKKSGMLPDDLVVYAIQDGYLPQDATESDLVNLIELAISGKKVEPIYSEQGQEDMAVKYAERAAEEQDSYEERADQTDAEWYGMSEQEYMDQMSQELAATNTQDFKALDDAISELMDTPASTMSARAAMEALGFSEQEIQDEERRTATKAGEAAPTEKAPVPAEGEAPAELELKQQTTEELKAKQDEIDRLTKENERLAKEAEAKAKADAERGEFVLTGSNRPADEAAARGQKDIFAAEEEKPVKQEPKEKAAAEPEPSKEYQLVLNESRDAYKEFAKAQEAYRAQTIGDDEFLAARKKYDVVMAKYDDAYAKEQERMVAEEVVGPEETPSLPRLTREPYTFEGEFTEKGEEEQIKLLEAPIEKLNKDQINTLEKHYGAKRGSAEFIAGVRQDVIDFVVKGATAVNGKIRAIIRALANGVLATSLVFNPQFISHAYTVSIPQYDVSQREVLQQVPEGVRKDMSEAAQRAYAVIYPSLKPQLTANNKFFIVADKQTATTFIFNPDGSPFMHDKTLFGAGIGDFMKGDNNVVANRITPAGLFDLGMRDAHRSAEEAYMYGDYDFGKVFVLDKAYMGRNGPYSQLVMHSVWVNEKDAKQRLAALDKPGAEDSRYSFGCINVKKEAFRNLVTNHMPQMDGAKIFIVPENGSNVMDFVNGEATYSPDIIRQRVAPVTEEVKTEKQRAEQRAGAKIYAREEEGRDYLSIEGPQTQTPAFKKWFGDSKVVDKDGNPLVVYHGSKRDFDKFEFYKKPISNLREESSKLKGWTDVVGTDKQDGSEFNVAKVYKIDDSKSLIQTHEGMEIIDTTKQSPVKYLNAKFNKPQASSERIAGGHLAFFFAEDPAYTGYYSIWGKEGSEDRPVTYPVYLSIQNPITPKDWSVFEPFYQKATRGGKALDDIKKAFFNQRWEAMEMYPGLIDYAKSKGYDGYQLIEGGASTFGFTPMTEKAPGGKITWAVFEPNQIKSAIGNRGTFDESGNILQSVEQKPTDWDYIPEIQEAKKRNPSLTRKLNKLKIDHDAGKITDEKYIEEVDAALELAEVIKEGARVPPRVRGYRRIKEVLNRDVRKGFIDPEAADLAEWFIDKNPDLVEQLGISVKAPSESGVGGFYSEATRIITLIKEGNARGTITHEILHHLERMMPAKIQQSIRKAWSTQLLAAQKKAKTPAEKLYFAALMEAHYGSNDHYMITVTDGDMSVAYVKALSEMHLYGPGNRSALELAKTILKNGGVSIDLYQFFNPSEFWAVNGTRIVEGRYDAVKGSTLAKLKNWLREFAQKIKGLLGLNSDLPILRALDSLSKSDGTFVSKKMLGDGFAYENIHTNYKGGPMPNPTWSMPKSGPWEQFIQTYQDNYLDLKKAQQIITKQSGELDQRLNAYGKEVVSAGRSSSQLKDFAQFEVRPLLTEMLKNNVSNNELSEYLQNRYAPERNEIINEKNQSPSVRDQGSGIHTDDAAKYMKNLDKDRKKILESLAKRIDDIVYQTQENLIASGQETRETIEQWRRDSPHYVPLQRDESEMDFLIDRGGIRGTRGLGTQGKFGRQALGSTKTVVNIIENVMIQRERAVMRSENARIGRALYAQVIANPNPDFWMAIKPGAAKNKEKLLQQMEDFGLDPEFANNIVAEPRTARLTEVSVPNDMFNDKSTRVRTVTYQVDRMYRQAKNVFPVRINGEDVFVLFNPKSVEAIRLVDALKDNDPETIGLVVGAASNFTNWFTAVNSQYNLAFGLINFWNDTQGAWLKLSATPLAGKRRLFEKNVIPALLTLGVELRRQRGYTEKEAAKEFSVLGKGLVSKENIDYLRRMREAGGMTGMRDSMVKTKMHLNLKNKKWSEKISFEEEHLVERELKALQRGPVAKKAIFFADLISDTNDMLENASRLAAFKVAVMPVSEGGLGLSDEEGAIIAKELTINFNKHGARTKNIRGLYGFFNATVQSTANLATTLAGPAGRSIVKYGLMLGAAQAMLLVACGYDDDEPPDFVKNKGFIIPTGNNKYFVWNLPGGFRALPNMGRLITEGMLIATGIQKSNKGLGGKALESAGVLVDAVNPFGNAGSVLQLAAPTFADPIVALTENKDPFGRPIYKEDSNLKPTPGWQRTRDSARTISKGLSYMLNYITSGGEPFAKGFISPTGDEIDYTINQIIGGGGKEIEKGFVAAGNAVTGEPTPAYKRPLLNRVAGEIETPEAESARFYDNVTMLAQHKNIIEGRAREGGDVEGYIKKHPLAQYAGAGSSIENNVSNMNSTLHKLRNMPQTPEMKQTIKEIESARTEAMKALNDLVKESQ